MKFINLTRNNIHFYHQDGSIETFPSNGKVYLMPEHDEPYNLNGYFVVDASSTVSINGLPAVPESGEIPALIVSRLAAEAVSSLWPGEGFVPDTSPASVVRDHSHKIIGVRRWERWSGDDD